jgi:hypothetical protein
MHSDRKRHVLMITVVNDGTCYDDGRSGMQKNCGAQTKLCIALYSLREFVALLFKNSTFFTLVVHLFCACSRAPHCSTMSDARAIAGMDICIID